MADKQGQSQQYSAPTRGRGCTVIDRCFLPDDGVSGDGEDTYALSTTSRITLR